MGTESKISWTHHTFNPWRGCTRASTGCRSCYAETMSARNPAVLGIWGTHGSRPTAAESYWKLPFIWNANAENTGERRRVFCASLADVFEGAETMPVDQWVGVEAARARLWRTIEATPQLDWLLLTKRPQHIMALAPSRWQERFPENVWIGTSVENQQTANERIPLLLQVPARIRWLSAEPLLEAVDLKSHLLPGRIAWVVVGGESGANARPFDPTWAEDISDQCFANRVPLFVKQMGSVWAKQAKAHERKGEDPTEWSESLQVRMYPVTQGVVQ